MAPLPESAFRSLLADCEQSVFAAFVADLWRARGREVRRVGDRLVADGRELRPVVDLDGTRFRDQGVGRAPASDAILVTATPPPEGTGRSVVGPGELYRVLLYDVPRERAADLFETHFDRPLEGESTGDPSGSTGSTSEPTSATDTPSDESTGSSPDGTAETTAATDGPADETTPSPAGGPRRRLVRAADQLARRRDDLRALVGDRRVQAVAAVVLLVVAASLWGLFVYQPDPEPSDPPFAVDGEQPPVDGSYRVVAQMHATSEGEQWYFESSRTYVPGEPTVSMGQLILGGPDDWTTAVNFRRGNVSYSRRTWTNASRYRNYLERVGDRGDVVRTSNSTRSVYRVRHRPGGSPATPTGGISTSTLSQLPYERDGTATYEGRDVVRYVPTTGWTASDPGPGADSRTYRVRSASGEILVDAETGALLYADVEATIVPAENWADVLTEPDHDVSVQYRVETDVDRPRAPPWVEGLDANDNVTNATAGNATVTNATAG